MEDTEEKILGDREEHYLTERYLLRDRTGQEGKVEREVQRLDEGVKKGVKEGGGRSWKQISEGGGQGGFC